MPAALARFLDRLAEDLRHGLRLAGRNRGFATVVVLLLALGIGATTAVFSVVRAVVLTPLPYPRQERLVMIWETEPEAWHTPLSGPNFLDWQRAARSFDAMAAVSPRSYSLAGGAEPERVHGADVTAEVFEVLGTAALLGRTFAAEEMRPGGPPVAVLSDRLWRRSFAASPLVLGETVMLDGEPHTVIGVMPPGFDVLTPWSLGRAMELWTPLPLSSAEEQRDRHSFLAIARLAAGVGLAEGQREMDAVTAALAAEYPRTNRGHGARVAPLHDELFGWMGAQLLTLLAAAAFVLLIVCANVGGLLLAKMASRENEMAVRSSLGAGRGRLVRQLLVENLPLVVLGGAAGVLFTGWVLESLRAFIPYAVVRDRELSLDVGILAFTAALALLAVLLFGLAPALAGSRADVAAALHPGRRMSLAGHGGARRLLIVAQLALTLVLANGAALMLASYWKLQHTDQGFDREEVLTARLSMDGPRFDDLARAGAFCRDMLERVRSIPGVDAVAVTTKLPLAGGTNERVTIEGREHDWGEEPGPLVERSLVTPGYFRAMGIPRFAGRTLAEADASSELAVAVVNQAMARVAWPGEDPVGRRFALEAGGGWITVVGVVSDARQLSEHRARPEYYLPLSPLPAYWTGWTPRVWRLYLVVRAAGEPESLVAVLKREIRAVDPLQPFSDVRTMEQILHATSARRRFNTSLIAIFAGMGVLLVATGIYGLMSTFVAQRTREIGMRVALGADRQDVLRLVSGQGVRLIGLGVAAGLAAVLATTRIIEGLLYDVRATEPAVLVVGTAFVVLVGCLGTLLPALRATRIDPATALRTEN